MIIKVFLYFLASIYLFFNTTSVFIIKNYNCLVSSENDKKKRENFLVGRKGIKTLVIHVYNTIF